MRGILIGIVTRLVGNGVKGVVCTRTWRKVAHLTSWGEDAWVAELVGDSREIALVSKYDWGSWKSAGNVKIAHGWDG